MLHARGSPHRSQQLVGDGMGDGALGRQAGVVQARQFVVAQALAGEAAGGELLSERLCSQSQFLPSQFLGLGQAPFRPSFAQWDGGSAATPGTARSRLSRDDHIDGNLRKFADIGKNTSIGNMPMWAVSHTAFSRGNAYGIVANSEMHETSKNRRESAFSLVPY